MTCAYLPVERDLSRHADVAADRQVRGQREQRCGDGDACRGAVLLRGAFWEVDVDVVFFEELVAEDLVAEVLREGVSDLRALLHHVAQRAGDRDLASSGLRFFAAAGRSLGGWLDESCGGGLGERSLGSLDEENASPERAVAEADRYASRQFERVEPFGAEDGRTDEALDVFGLDEEVLPAFFDDLETDLLEDSVHALVERPDACFSRVLLDEGDQRGVQYLDFVVFEALRFDGFGDQVVLGDGLLFLHGVARQLDDFQAVQQRVADGVQEVRGADEEHLREVERCFEEVVSEAVVLGRVEHFEQRVLDVAFVAGCYLVYLVQEDHRVFRLRLFESHHQLAWVCSDVGFPVAFDQCDVALASERYPHELSTKTLSNRRGYRSLSDAWRTDQQDVLALRRVPQL